MKVKRSIKVTNNRIDIHIRHSSKNNRYTEYQYKKGELYTVFNRRTKYSYCIEKAKFHSQKWN